MAALAGIQRAAGEKDDTPADCLLGGAWTGGVDAFQIFTFGAILLTPMARDLLAALPPPEFVGRRCSHWRLS